MLWDRFDSARLRAVSPQAVSLRSCRRSVAIVAACLLGAGRATRQRWQVGGVPRVEHPFSVLHVDDADTARCACLALDGSWAMAVRVGELADSSSVARRIATTQRALIASREYLRSLLNGVKAPRVPEGLLQHDCIVYSELATQNAWSFTAGSGAPMVVGSQVTIRALANFQTNSSEVICATVLSGMGMGIGYSPTWLFEHETAAGELQVLLPDWPESPLPLPLPIASPPQRRQSAKVQAFA
jgi:DNA-binding transcriptional LysR family regulator